MAARGRQQNRQGFVEGLQRFRRLAGARERNGVEAARQRGIETLVSGFLAFALIGALRDLERVVVVASRQHDSDAGETAADGFAARRLPFCGPDIDLVVELGCYLILPLKIQDLREEDLRADHLSRIDAVSEPLIDIDDLALELLGFGVASLF